MMWETARVVIASTVATDLLPPLERIVGPTGLVTDPQDLTPYLTDWRRRYHGATPCVVRPRSTAEVSAVVKLLTARGVPVVPQGGNTGLCGGATPDESGRQVVLSLSRLQAIRAVDVHDNAITAEAGCVLARLQQAAAEVDRLFPLSLASEGSCQLGGVISTNAGGVAVLRYGPMRDLVLGLEVVLPDGEVFSKLSGLRKDNTGYDLKQLFIGAEGTLGVVTAATVKLFPRPRQEVTALVSLRNLDDAIALLRRLQDECGDAVTAFEVWADRALDLLLQNVPGHRAPFEQRTPFYALFDVASFFRQLDARSVVEAALDAASEAGLIVDATVAASEAQAQSLWRIREEIPEGERRSGPAVKHDISVSVARIPAFLASAEAAIERSFPGSTIIVFGHLGDGSLHYNVVPAGIGKGPIAAALQADVYRVVHDVVADHGGSISAEHGIGRLKRDELWRYRPELDHRLMRLIKGAFDPAGLMNPDKVI